MVSPPRGHERSGRGNPMKNTGRQNKGRRGDDKTALTSITDNTMGNRKTDKIRMEGIDLWRCFLRPREVTARVNMKMTFWKSCWSLSRHTATRRSCTERPALFHQVAVYATRYELMIHVMERSRRLLKVFCHTWNKTRHIWLR